MRIYSRMSFRAFSPDANICDPSELAEGETRFFFNQCHQAETLRSSSTPDKCFIEFNYVEMLIMSNVYKRRKALPIKS